MSSLDQITSTALSYVPSSKHPSFRSAMVLVAALFEGPDVQRIAAVTGYDQAFVEQVAERLRTSLMWVGNKIDYSDWRNLSSFALDLGVADGILLRTQRKRKGKYIYQSLVYTSNNTIVS